MRRLNRYISRSVFLSICVVLLILGGIDLLSMIIRESAGIKGNYTLGNVFQFVAWSMPSTFVDYIANASFLGCVIGLGIHASSNELVVIRAAGVGMKRLMWAVFRPVLLIAIVGLLVNEYITPHTLRQAEAVQQISSKDVNTLQSRNGYWYKDDSNEGKTTFVYFRGLNQNLFDVVQYTLDADKKQMLASSFAEEAVFYSEAGSSQAGWRLEQSSVSEFPPMLFGPEATAQALAAQTVSHEMLPSTQWQTRFTPTQANDIVLLPEQLSISSLYRLIEYFDEQSLDNRDYQLAFWQKVLQPVLIVALTLVGISFVFGSLREVSIWQRTTIAFLVGIVFSIFQELLARVSQVYQISPLVAMLIPIGLCLILGVYLLRRQ